MVPLQGKVFYYYLGITAIIGIILTGRRYHLISFCCGK
jgi:hypothetical protein